MSEFSKIGEHASIRRGASPRPINNPIFFGGEVGWVRISDVTSSRKYLRRTSQFVSKLGESLSVKVNQGDLIMSICGTIGKPIIIDIPACIHDGFVLFYNIIDTDSEYLYYLLQFHEPDLIKKGQPGTQINLNTTIVSNFSAYFPKDIYIQKKIAKILNFTDELIQKSETAIEKYKAIKTGMMQELFNYGIDVKTGKLRPTYKEAPELYKQTKLGWIPKEWEVATIKDVCNEFINGGTPSTKNPSYWIGTIPWITGADFLETFEVGYIRRHINENALIGSSTHLIKSGNILLVTRTGVGKLAIAPFDVAISQDITGLVLNAELLDVGFFYYYLQVLVEDFKKMNQGTSINGIIRNDLEEKQIARPPINEQKMIKRVLGSIDSLIKNETNDLAKYNQLKIGLMSDLLTGKVRIEINNDELERD